MNTSETSKADTSTASRKRGAESPLPEAPSSPRMQPSRKRARTSNTRTTKATAKPETDEWAVLQGKLDDVLSGRADTRLQEWEKGWRQSCEILDEQKSFKLNEKELLQDVGALLKSCAHLEHKLGIRD